MSGFRSLALSVLCVATMAAPAAAQDRAQIPTPVEVSLSRATVSTQLGESFDFRSTVTNSGAQPVSGLVAHLNVVGLDTDIYVDPEDWSEERTKNVPALGPGESTEVAWDVTAVTGGEAAIYVVALPGDSPATAREGLATSPAMDVNIAEAKNLNTEGVLPLALGVPAFLALVTLAVRRRR
jgi:uncharacterized membrane protein